MHKTRYADIQRLIIWGDLLRLKSGLLYKNFIEKFQYYLPGNVFTVLCSKVVFIVFFSCLITFCKEDSNATKKVYQHPIEKKLKDQFMRSFDIPKDKNEPIVGVWRANQKELVAFVQKKFLSKSKIPKGNSRKEMTEQLQSTNMFLNFASDGKMVMIIFAYNGVPAVSIGLYKKLRVSKKVRSYKGTLTGKEGKRMPISINLYSTNGSRRIVYKEKAGSMTFYPDERPAALILEGYALKLRRHAVGNISQ